MEDLRRAVRQADKERALLRRQLDESSARFAALEADLAPLRSSLERCVRPPTPAPHALVALSQPHADRTAGGRGAAEPRPTLAPSVKSWP